METAVLINEKEHPHYPEVVVSFPFQGKKIIVKMELEMQQVYASVPCEKCAKNTRSLLRALGAEVPEDDAQVNVGEIIMGLPEDEETSIMAASSVYAITKVSVNKIAVDGKDLKFPEAESLSKEVEEHAKKVLIGHQFCDGCLLLGKALDTLLSA